MEIDKTRSLGRTNAQPKADKKKAGQSAFMSVKNSAAQPTGAPKNVGPVFSVSSLLAVHEVGQHAESKKKGMQHGHDLLDQLERIRLSLLMGSVSVNQLRQIRGRICEIQPESLDPELKNVLDDIEMRVQIELAKLGF